MGGCRASVSEEKGHGRGWPMARDRSRQKAGGTRRWGRGSGPARAVPALPAIEPEQKRLGTIVVFFEPEVCLRK